MIAKRVPTIMPDLTLEEGSVPRVNRALAFPASFMLIAAMNPCPCGFYI